MTVYLAADHRGFKLKNALRDWLKGERREVVDLGSLELDKDDDYPDLGITLAEKVAGDSGSLGVAVCGSGVGMAMAAGKVKGARAMVAHQPELAAAGRRDDDVNVISIGADFIDEEKAKKIVKAALETNFSGEERHKRRIEKIRQYENGNC